LNAKLVVFETLLSYGIDNRIDLHNKDVFSSFNPLYHRNILVFNI